ncbi:response regulator [Rufibacter sp. LB8]|uniref:response regulator n=1 Tax=Rufibacter sp. LB8 TaxID=2777781 RepID=UPI00178C8055|nr:response regulator [Rufibacter sp. LB8]
MSTPSTYIIVDDDPTNNMICEFIIQRFNSKAQVTSFLEPEAALAYISHPDAVDTQQTIMFLDINMPSMTGWEFLELYQSFSEDLKKKFTIYILSSSLEILDKEKAANNPWVAGFLSKPLEFNCLQEIMDNR